MRRPGEMRPDGGLDEVEDGSALRSEGFGDREHALYETGALRGIGSEGAFAPEDGFPQRALRPVVGRLDALDPGEGPEAAVALEDIPAEGGGLLLRRGRAPSEEALQTGSLALEQGLEAGVGDLSGEIPAVGLRDGLLGPQPGIADTGGSLVPQLLQGREVALQMCPAEATFGIGVPMVGGPAVRPDGAGVVRAHQRVEGLGASAPVDQEDRKDAGSGSPE